MVIFYIINFLKSSEKTQKYISNDILGMAYLIEEDYFLAKNYFDLSIDLDSSQYISYYNRSICHRLMGNEEASLADINTAISKV